jgi:hypothetical protein
MYLYQSTPSTSSVPSGSCCSNPWDFYFEPNKITISRWCPPIKTQQDEKTSPCTSKPPEDKFEFLKPQKKPQKRSHNNISMNPYTEDDEPVKSPTTAIVAVQHQSTLVAPSHTLSPTEDFSIIELLENDQGQYRKVLLIPYSKIVCHAEEKSISISE